MASRRQNNVSIDIGLIRRFFPFLKPHLGVAAITIALTPLIELTHIARPYLVGLAIDEGASAGNIGRLAEIAWIYIGLALAGMALGYVHTYITNLTGQRIVRDMRQSVYDFMQSRSIRFFESHPIGALIARGSNDLEVIAEMFASGVVMTIADSLRLVGIIGVMFYLNSRLTLIILASTPLVILFGAIFGAGARRAFRRQRTLIADVGAAISETTAGRKLIQLYLAGAENEEQFDRLNNDLRNAGITGIAFEALLFATMEKIAWLASAALIWYGGGSIVQRTLSLGELIAFLDYLTMFFDPIRDLTSKWSLLQSGLAALEKTDALLKNEDVIDDRPDPAALDAPIEKVQLEKVDFSYVEGENVLSGFDLEAVVGRRVALIGPTGSGKSTALKLLVRFFDPIGGRAAVNDIDLVDLKASELRRRVAYTPQDVYLFEGTVLENITLGRDDINEADAIEAARQTGLHELVLSMPLEYNTRIAERGGNFSSGEQQLIALTRALAYRPDVLLLDEATANIDSAAEDRIIRALAEATSGRTSIVVAHRLSTITSADIVIVLSGGRVIESGPPRELYQSKGVYYRLASIADQAP